MKIFLLMLLMVIAAAGIMAPCAVLAQASKTDLTLNVVYDNFSSLKAGEQRTVYLEVANNGDTELTNVKLSSESPAGWRVEFTPLVIDKLEPGNVQTVNILLQPADNTTKGDYNIAVIAEADGLRRVTNIYVNVQSTSLFWVWVAAGIAVLLIAGAVAIFFRFGREEK
jgi:uncharacterized membrane protein